MTMTEASFDNLVPSGYIDVEAAIGRVATLMHWGLPEHETVLAFREKGFNLVQSGARWKAASREVAKACIPAKQAVSGNSNPKPPLPLHVCHPSWLPMPFAIGPHLIEPLRIFVGGYSGLALAPDRVTRSIGLAITQDDTTEGWVLAFERQQFEAWCQHKRDLGLWPIKKMVEERPYRAGQPSKVQETAKHVRKAVDQGLWNGGLPFKVLEDVLKKEFKFAVSDKTAKLAVKALYNESKDNRYKTLDKPRRARKHSSE
jgi:hypothetical protein